jgi:putative transposase
MLRQLTSGDSSGQKGGTRRRPDPHYRRSFPAELISHAVWLYHVFSLSGWDVELILGERGVTVSYESIRRWCLKFGTSFADNLAGVDCGRVTSVGVDGPDGIACAKVRSLQISDNGDRPGNRKLSCI